MKKSEDIKEQLHVLEILLQVLLKILRKLLKHKSRFSSMLRAFHHHQLLMKIASHKKSSSLHFSINNKSSSDDVITFIEITFTDSLIFDLFFRIRSSRIRVFTTITNDVINSRVTPHCILYLSAQALDDTRSDVTSSS